MCLCVAFVTLSGVILCVMDGGAGSREELKQAGWAKEETFPKACDFKSQTALFGGRGVRVYREDRDSREQQQEGGDQCCQGSVWLPFFSVCVLGGPMPSGVSIGNGHWLDS